jgi:hypothetical protein
MPPSPKETPFTLRSATRKSHEHHCSERAVQTLHHPIGFQVTANERHPRIEFVLDQVGMGSVGVIDNHLGRTRIERARDGGVDLCRHQPSA